MVTSLDRSKTSAAAPYDGKYAWLDLWSLWAAVACLTIFAGLCLISYSPPLGDFNEWIFQGWLTKFLLVGGHLRHVHFKPWPVPNVTSQWTLAFLCLVFRPLVAGKIFIISYLALGAIVSYKISKTKKDSVGVSFLLLIVIVVLHSPLWIGEINFQVGLVALMYAVFFMELKPECIGNWRILGFSLVLFASHAICFAAFALYVVLKKATWSTRMRRAVALVPAALALVWYQVSDPRVDAIVIPGFSSLRDAFSYRFYELAKAGPYRNMIIHGAGDYDRHPLVYDLGVGANCLFGLLLAWLLLDWIVSKARNRDFGAATIVGFTCVAGAIIDPIQQLKVGNLSERLFTISLIFLLIAHPLRPVLRLLLATTASLAVIFLTIVLIDIPKGQNVEPFLADSAINGGSRYRILFWYRPFLFREQLALVDLSREPPPSVSIAYQTSLLAN